MPCPVEVVVAEFEFALEVDSERSMAKRSMWFLNSNWFGCGPVVAVRQVFVVLVASWFPIALQVREFGPPSWVQQPDVVDVLGTLVVVQVVPVRLQ